jgi:transcriptional regulator with XRE-family HTH domain
MYPDKIGERLKLIREAWGLRPAEMADLLNIERTYWSRFEGGKRAMSDEVGYLLTERFGVTFDFLLLGKWDKLPLDVAERLRKVSK